MTGGTDLARPAWDASGRLWLLDRRPGGARVLVATGGNAREVRVAGVTGQDARQLLVSRDGTRLVALVRGSGGERLVAARVVLGPRGAAERTVESRVIWSEPDVRVIDVAWTGAVELAVLSPARPGELFEVETVSVDGATVGIDTFSTMVSGRILGLAGEPYPQSPTYAIAATGLIDIRTGERLAATGRVGDIDYAG
jgi:hypothetical protein